MAHNKKEMFQRMLMTEMLLEEMEDLYNEECAKHRHTLSLLNAVYAIIESERPQYWASLPLGLQSRVAAALEIITQDEIIDETTDK